MKVTIGECKICEAQYCIRDTIVNDQLMITKLFGGIKEHKCTLSDVLEATHERVL